MSTQSPVLIDVPEELDGPRIRLWPFRADDALALWEAIEESRERLEPWMPWVQSDRSVEDVRLFVARAQAEWLLRENLHMGILDRNGRRLLGVGGFHHLDWGIRSFEIGYWLRTSAEGQGYMQEAVQLLTRVAFGTLDANRVEIHVDPRNVRSCNVARRLGFVLEGTLRNCAPDGYGLPSDRHVFGLTPADYSGLDWVRSLSAEVPQ